MSQAVPNSALSMKEPTHDRESTTISGFPLIWKLYQSQEIQIKLKP